MFVSKLRHLSGLSANAGRLITSCSIITRGRHGVTQRHITTLTSHEMRGKVSRLYHERMFEKITLPTVATTITTTQKLPVDSNGILCPMGSVDQNNTHSHYEADYAHVRKICDFFHVHPPAHGMRFHSVDLGGVCHMRWERHTEMQTYTFFKPVDSAETFSSPFAPQNVPVNSLPSDWLATLPGAVITALHIAVVGDSKAESATALCPDEFREAKRLLNHNGHVVGAAVHRGTFRAYTDFKEHGDSYGRIVLYPMPNLAHRMAGGKVIQRLIEVDKYRKMALVALPLAQQLAPEVERLNGELQSVMTAVQTLDADMDNDERRDNLHRLCRLSGLSLKHQTMSEYRFSASTSYSELVDDRLDDLNVEKIEGIPNIRTFVQSTTHPAIRTCKSVAARLKSFSQSSQLTAELMQTSLTVRQQAHSAEQLVEIKSNAKTQLLLQESVEGLSVVAITYYSCGVLGYVLKSAAAIGALAPLGVAPEVLLGGAVPVVGFAVWRGLHDMKTKVLGPK